MRKLIVWIFVTLVAFGAARQLSPLPLPTIRFLSLDTYPCDRYCLQEHLERGEIFSFLAKLQPQQTPYFKEVLVTIPFIKTVTYKEHISIALVTANKKLAPLLSKTAKTLGAILLRHEQPFTVTTHVEENLQDAIDNLQESDLIIAFIPFAQREQSAQLVSSTPLFIPTINRRFVTTPSTQYYGGIDYYAQTEALLQTSTHPLQIFYTPHIELTSLLTQYATQLKDDAKLIEVKNGGSDLKWQIKNRTSLQNSDILLNTPLVTTSLVLSQLTLYEYTPPKKLSTQINLSAKLFTFTQENDRKNLIFANISHSLEPLSESSAFLFDTNFFYDWIDYASLMGMQNILMPNSSTPTPFVEQQLQFGTDLWYYKTMGFERIPQESSEEFLPDGSPSSRQAL